MLALWHAVAADGPVGRFDQAQFTAYYLGVRDDDGALVHVVREAPADVAVDLDSRPVRQPGAEVAGRAVHPQRDRMREPDADVMARVRVHDVDVLARLPVGEQQAIRVGDRDFG